MSISSILVLVFIVLIGILSSAKKKALSEQQEQRRAQQRKTIVFDEETGELVMRAIEPEPKTVAEKKMEVVDRGIDTKKENGPAESYLGVQSSISLDINEGFEMEKKDTKGFEIDPSNMIIYYELMKPKFGEF
ncbi:MAG: hypothetical protein M0R23_02255 [Bacteroidales bacterium]|nr:hypothetical protein [Bacteroidales bacterium]